MKFNKYIINIYIYMCERQQFENVLMKVVVAEVVMMTTMVGDGALTASWTVMIIDGDGSGGNDDVGGDSCNSDDGKWKWWQR